MTINVPQFVSTGYVKSYRTDLDDESLDVLVEFAVRPHSFFRRTGDDAFCTVDISIYQAALGTKVMVPHLYGGPGDKFELVIPPGSQPGHIIKIADFGFVRPANSRAKRGDLFVSVNVQVPRCLTEEQVELFERLAAIDCMVHLSMSQTQSRPF
eukprot:TRINITY_DN826_c0_g1_i2.p3 TRINITY_DN826_c0_g1~~TRINITY_DN826_c0_g1_i2.p3  ORF type:complete len:154 (+),score=57.60 TRINITY_DN826_c0_g1_i2:406-867(+)